MNKLLIFACCTFLLIGCSSTTTSPSDDQSKSAINAEQDSTTISEQTIETSQHDDAYQKISIGSFDTMIPSEWIVKDKCFYVAKEGACPFIYYEILENFTSLDALFPDTESMNTFIDQTSAGFFDTTVTKDNMIRQIHNSMTCLEFTVSGLRDNLSLVQFYSLYSNPGGGVVAISMVLDANSGDSNSNAIAGYSNMLYELTPSAGKGLPSDSFQASTGDLNALSSAMRYLKTMHYSYSGLKEQLLFEGYTESEASFGVDNCNANWKEQAAGKAQDYLNSGSFSKVKLIEQLEFEGFTKSQAEYGVSKVYD
jgi:hypothetical protein